MKGDFSRLTYRPEAHFDGVRMQQGRVQLDADFNEQVDIQQHRDRTEARDVIGPSGVPKHHGGFAIGITPDARDLTISPGRIYVDGLLCELDDVVVPVERVDPDDSSLELVNRQQAEERFEADRWVELRAQDVPPLTARVESVDPPRTVKFAATVDLTAFVGVDDVTIRAVATYATQPHWPDPEVLGTTERRTDLVYLDVWQRHLTAVDEPALLEQALGGVDTATRTQTVWQVKVLADVGDVECDDAIEGWPPPASKAELTTTVVPEDDEDDPCVIPASGGYSGLENRLYRVEVHHPANGTPATFKWSRDNGSVTLPIEEFVGGQTTNRLRVGSMGRDRVLGIKKDDWIEVLDESIELAGGPGKLVLVTNVDEVQRIVTIADTVPAVPDAARPKVRKWDNKATAPLEVQTSSWIKLESGIQVRFGGKDFQSGDFWTFAARTATGEIEELDGSPPDGVEHHYTPLALVTWESETSGDGSVAEQCLLGGVKADCRTTFPPLTNICAEDVCFDNDTCNLTEVETVQDVLDRLCTEHDLSHHNKHLHGWGIVCGLQVECDSGDCRSVLVRDGYALDPHGNDVILREDRMFDVVGALQADGRDYAGRATSVDGDYQLSIRLDPDRGVAFDLEPYEEPDNILAATLQGTLLMDFIDDCVGNLVRAVKAELDADEDAGERSSGLVGPGQKRLTTLLNLVIQFINPTNGSYVFLSQKEHEILEGIYERLRKVIHSKTFCGMNRAADFPDYPFGSMPSTIFGKHLHTRLRVHPDGQTAYSCGMTGGIAVYDLATEELVQELAFPTGAGTAVQDVAFIDRGTRMCAISQQGDHTVFAIAQRTGSQWSWTGETTTLCDVKLVTLAHSESLPEFVYATGKGRGLFALDPNDLPTEPTPLSDFAAVGHLVIVEETGAEGTATAYATAARQAESASGGSDAYGAFVRIDLPDAGNVEVIDLSATGADGEQRLVTGDDDLVAAVDISGPLAKVYVVVDTKPGKAILAYDMNTVPDVATVIPGLGETEVRLGYNDATNYVVASLSDGYRLALIDAAKDELLNDYRHPVQIIPSAIASSPQTKMVCVLNFMSRTVTTIPAADIPSEPPFDVEALARYRMEVIQAFLALANNVIQYLKDCFCDHLLVNCPDPDPTGKLYLASITVQDEEVYKICNFSGRKYVKTFPTVAYWMSLVPVLPFLGLAIDRICCMIVPDFGKVGRVAAPSIERDRSLEPERSMERNRLSSSRVMQATDLLQGVDLGGTLRRLTNALIRGRSAAAGFLSGEDIDIAVPGMLKRLTGREKEETSEGPTLRDRMPAGADPLRGDLEDLRKEVDRIKTSYKRALDTRDRKIKRLETKVDRLTKKRSENER